MKRVLLALAVSASHLCVSAQGGTEGVINSSGGSHEADNTTYEWSVGEISLVNTSQSNDGKLTLTQGFLQPMYGIPSRSRKPVAYFENEVRILPNPATEKLVVHYKIPETGKLKMTLYNETGKLVFRKTIENSGQDSFETIYVSNLPNGTYILNIRITPTDDKQSPRSNSFKIVKIS